MQVINLTNNILKYYTKGTKIELKPGIITYVSDDIISVEKLKSCYGSRINIIDETRIGEVYKEYAGNVKPVEPPVKEDKVEPVKENKTEDKVEPVKENKTEDKVESAKPSTKATKSKTSTKKVSKGKSTKSKKNK